jgi:beta-fructofuranosidase
MDHFPRFHPRPATGWVNDPNGIGFWDGRWHVMMQWNPHGARWGDIHWAHLSSADLLAWEEHPAALSPRPGTIDAGGAWSGVAAVDDAGRRVLLYSATPAGPAEAGVAIARPEPVDPESPDAAAALAWIQPDAMTLPHPDTPGVRDVRDPFLVEVDGRRLALQGCRIDDRGAVLLFDARDLDAWRPLGTLLRVDDLPPSLPRRGDVWECPQLARVGDTWVLVVSWFELAEPAANDGTGDAVGPRGVTAYAGAMVREGDGYRFVAHAGGPLDLGDAFYAPQLATAPDGRVLCWGWVPDENRDPAAADESGWAGAVTFPREVVVDDAGVPALLPVAELEGLRGESLGAGARVETGEPAWVADVDGEWTVALSDGHATTPDRRVLAGSGPARVWVDGSVVEAFAPHGSTVRAYPTASESWVVTASAGTQVWRLRG